MIGTQNPKRRNYMAEHDAGRREFLVRAIVGTGAIAGAELVPSAIAQNAAHEPGEAQARQRAALNDALTHAAGEHHGAFFNHTDAETVAAFAERLMPSAAGKPGAHDTGVLNYIDLALAGAYSDL